MREVDRVATEEVGLSLLQMMENAGARTAAVVRWVLGEVDGRHVAVLAGSGGNGGGALAAARHLAIAGAEVSVHLARAPTSLSAATAVQLELAVAADARVRQHAPAAEIVVDGLLGYGQRGAPRDRHAELIAATSGQRVVALDVPSGLELATGERHAPGIAAEATVTLALPKRGLARHREVVGELVLADIGIPASVYRRTGIPPPRVFADGPLVRLLDA